MHCFSTICVYGPAIAWQGPFVASLQDALFYYPRRSTDIPPLQGGRWMADNFFMARIARTLPPIRACYSKYRLYPKTGRLT